MSRYPPFHRTAGRQVDFDRGRREAQQVQKELNMFETRYQHWSESARYHWLQRPEARLDHRVNDEMIGAWLYKHRDNLPKPTHKDWETFFGRKEFIEDVWKSSNRHQDLETCQARLFGAWADGWQDAHVDPPEPALGPRNEALLDAEIVDLDQRKDSAAPSSKGRRVIKFEGTPTQDPEPESKRSKSDIPGKTLGESSGKSSLGRIRERIAKIMKKTLRAWFNTDSE